MRIYNITKEERGEVARLFGNVVWEDSDREEQELFFEVDKNYSNSLAINSNAFVAAAILPALRYGEKRLSIEGEVCPVLLDRIEDVVSWMKHWYYNDRSEHIKIETKKVSKAPDDKDRNAGMFLSGGIDSLYTLRSNRLHYPLDHPGSIKDALLVSGLEVRDPEKFGYVEKHIRSVAKDADVNLIPIHTNILDLGPKDVAEFWGDFWVNEFEGAAFSAIAHALSNRLNKIFFSASYDVPIIFRWGKSFFTGSHPLIDSNFSSSDLDVHLYGISFNRYEKTKLVADWDVALNHMRVCNLFTKYQADYLNCGECEKCLRTMICLECLGVLDQSNAFASKDISLSRIKSAVTLSKVNFNYYEEMIEPLENAGMKEIAKIIRQKLFRKKLTLRTIEPLKDFDQKYAGGTLLKVKRLVSKKGISY